LASTLRLYSIPKSAREDYIGDSVFILDENFLNPIHFRDCRLEIAVDGHSIANHFGSAACAGPFLELGEVPIKLVVEVNCIARHIETPTANLLQIYCNRNCALASEKWFVEPIEMQGVLDPVPEAGWAVALEEPEVVAVLLDRAEQALPVRGDAEEIRDQAGPQLSGSSPFHRDR